MTTFFFFLFWNIKEREFPRRTNPTSQWFTSRFCFVKHMLQQIIWHFSKVLHFTSKDPLAASFFPNSSHKLIITEMRNFFSRVVSATAIFRGNFLTRIKGCNTHFSSLPHSTNKTKRKKKNKKKNNKNEKQN